VSSPGGCIDETIPYNVVMRRWFNNFPTGLLLLVLLTGCTASTPARDNGVAVGGSWQPCEGERPRVCTMIYDPVCGRRGDGSLNIYASPCNACADVAVSAWHPETCEE
jgi:hypothetical protein